MRELLNLPEIVDITDQLPKHPTKIWPKRSIESIELSVQHHTASEAPLINQALYHINHHNWAGLAYTFVVDRGNIYQTNDLLSLTSHASGANTIGVGVCINGDLSKRPMIDFERRAIIGIHITLKKLLGVEVMGHNEASKKYANHITACPVISMDKLREDIMSVENEIAFNESPQKKEEIAFRLMNQMNYFYNLSRGKNPDGSPATEGNKAWGLNMILSMESEFRKRGFLK